MLIFILFSFLMPLRAKAATTSWPTPNFENCEFYNQLEGIFNCRSKGVDYLAHYAPYYCENFKRESKNWDGALREWTRKTGLCLQKMLYEEKNNLHMNCNNLEAIAFATHSKCYDRAELCKLKLSEWVQIISVIKFRDLAKEISYSYKELSALLKSCLTE